MTTATKPRLEWVDAAKGLAILLVVLTHATEYATVVGAESPWWMFVKSMFSVMRMPLFFVLAGLFAASWVRRSWPELLRGKVLLLMWVYAVWVVFRFVFFSFVPSLVAPNEAASILRLLIQAVWSSMPTWFLYALAVFFVASKLMSRLPLWLQLGATGLVSLVFMSDLITLPSSLWTGLAEYFVFFLIGLHYSVELREGVADTTGRNTALALIPIWGVLAWSAVEADWLDVFGSRFLLSLVALPAGIGLGVLLSRSRALRYMGRNTMEIYLAHTLIQGGLAVVINDLPPSTLDSWAWWLPVALVIVGTLGSLVLSWLVRRIGLRGVYEAPAWLDRLALRHNGSKVIRPARQP